MQQIQSDLELLEAYDVDRETAMAAVTQKIYTMESLKKFSLATFKADAILAKVGKELGIFKSGLKALCDTIKYTKNLEGGDAKALK